MPMCYYFIATPYFDQDLYYLVQSPTLVTRLWSFPKIKSTLERRRFATIEDIQKKCATVCEGIRGFPKMLWAMAVSLQLVFSLLK